MRVLGVGEGELGVVLGLSAAISGFVGVTLGGVMADRWRARSPNGRLWVGVLTGVLPVPIAIAMFTTESRTLAYLLNVPLGALSAMWIGPGASTVQDLVLPRMRAIASAAYLLVITFIGLAMGPYTIGRTSVALGGDLRSAILWALVANAAAVLCAFGASRSLARDEATRLERARAAGEIV